VFIVTVSDDVHFGLAVTAVGDITGFGVVVLKTAVSLILNSLGVLNIWPKILSFH